MSALSSGGDRVVPTLARELAAQLSALFDRDVEIAKRQNDAQRWLTEANEQLWSGLSPEPFGRLYDGAGHAGSSQIAALIMDGAADGETVVLGALGRIHRGFCEYQSACEERRQLAIDVGEVTAKFIEVLCGAGFSEDDARKANVHELARPGDPVKDR